MLRHAQFYNACGGKLTNFLLPLPWYYPPSSYRYREITVIFLPLPREYRRNFPIYRGNTAVLPLSPLPCHCLAYTMTATNYDCHEVYHDGHSREWPIQGLEPMSGVPMFPWQHRPMIMPIPMFETCVFENEVAMYSR